MRSVDYFVVVQAYTGYLQTDHLSNQFQHVTSRCKKKNDFIKKYQKNFAIKLYRNTSQ